MIANKNIGIIVAMPGEYEGIVKSEEDREILDKPFTMYSRMIGDTKLITLISGVGKVNAACATQFMIENFAPEWIINIGVCGASASAYEREKVAIIDRAVNSDFDTSVVDGEDFQIPCVLLNTDREVENILYTADHFTTEEPVLQGKTVEGYFDMEGYAVASVSQLNDSKCTIIKSVTDVIKSGNQDEQYNCNYKVACERAKNKLRNVLDRLIIKV